MGIYRILVFYEPGAVLVWKQQDGWPFLSRNYAVEILRIEFLESRDRHSDDCAYLVEMQHPVHLESVHVGRKRRRSGLDAVLAVVAEGIHCTHESGHIPPGLPWEILIYVPELPAAAPSDGLVHVAGSAVIG